MKLTVGIPKEIKIREKRVPLTPDGVRRLVSQKIDVVIEKGAGLGSGFEDSLYQEAGARIAGNIEEVYSSAALIQKVKEPQIVEFDLIKPRHILFCFLHLASPENAAVLQALLKSQCTAIGYETIAKEGILPILGPMSKIAGGLSALYAAILETYRKNFKFACDHSLDLLKYLESVASQYPNLPGNLLVGRVVIYGGGVAGRAALEICRQLKGRVTMVDANPKVLEFFEANSIEGYSPEELPIKILEDADILIGAAHSRGKRAIQVMSEALIDKISDLRKKIMMDIAIDQGGNFPEAHATTYQAPVYLDSWGNLRFEVANIPSLAGKVASMALTDATLAYTTAMALDFKSALEKFPELKSGMNIESGQLKLQ